MDIDVREVRESIKNNGFYTFQTHETIVLATNAKREYLDFMPAFQIHAMGESFSRDQIKEGPWRKLAISSVNGLGESYAQFLLTTYFPETSITTPNINRFFDYLINLRNAVLELDDEFGSWDSDEKFWNASRIHHYPQGGGFMVEHSDTHFPKILSQSQIPFLQVMGLMSSRESDFEKGGGFISKANGDRVFFEDQHSTGKIVLFDGGIRHGVADIDSDKILDFQSKSGRIAAFVNLYEKR